MELRFYRTSKPVHACISWVRKTMRFAVYWEPLLGSRFSGAASREPFLGSRLSQIYKRIKKGAQSWAPGEVSFCLIQIY